MITAGVKELKNNLSRYLAKVKSGEEIRITERGTTIARIVRDNDSMAPIMTRLAPLILRGIVSMPTRKMVTGELSPVEAPGKAATEMVIEDRR